MKASFRNFQRLLQETSALRQHTCDQGFAHPDRNERPDPVDEASKADWSADQISQKTAGWRRITFSDVLHLSLLIHRAECKSSPAAGTRHVQAVGGASWGQGHQERRRQVRGGSILRGGGAVPACEGECDDTLSRLKSCQDVKFCCCSDL